LAAYLKSRRLVPGERRDVTAPFLGIVLEVGRQLPSRPAKTESLANTRGGKLVGYEGETVVRPALPEPIGRHLGVIAEALLALSKRKLGLLALFDVDGRSVPFDDPARLAEQRLGAKQKQTELPIEASQACLGLAACPGRQDRAPVVEQARNIVRMNRARPTPSQGLVR